VLHATFSCSEHALQGTDALPENYRGPQGFSVILSIASVLEAGHIFNTPSAGGAVHIPLQESFWAARFGVLIDQFGTPLGLR
jgi:PhnB protein